MFVCEHIQAACAILCATSLKSVRFTVTFSWSVVVWHAFEGGLSFEVREFFRETSSDTVPPADDVSSQSPTSQCSDVTEAAHITSTAQTTAAAATSAADGDGDDDYQHGSASSASSTWIAFKVFMHTLTHSCLILTSLIQLRHFTTSMSCGICC